MLVGQNGLLALQPEQLQVSLAAFTWHCFERFTAITPSHTSIPFGSVYPKLLATLTEADLVSQFELTRKAAKRFDQL